MRRLGKLGSISLVGTTGLKFPGIRKFMKEKLGEKYNLNVDCKTYPNDDVAKDCFAYKKAIDDLSAGDLVIIFTPDDTHFDIAMYAIQRRLHVLISKPAVKSVCEHKKLMEAARENGVFVMIEFHKRFDVIYQDAISRIRTLGDFSFFQSYMSQPKYQLETFKSWAGISSDISYYLNSHHIDIHSYALQGLAKPIEVMAMGSTGIAEKEPFSCPPGTEDVITLMVKWRNNSGSIGTALYTSSWGASNRADVHSQQRFHYIGHKGELNVDQAHRGYTVADDTSGFSSVNPLFMSYLPGPDGYFNGRHSYGYQSIENFVEAAILLRSRQVQLSELDRKLPTLQATLVTTAILEAGRKSLDAGKPVYFCDDESGDLLLSC
eukprot:Sdes_comp18041_c0_seq3m7381